jgi:uncharacterized protein (DUF2252 family)
MHRSSRNGRLTGFPTPAERRKVGRSLRQIVGRNQQGDWQPSANRLDPLVALEQVTRHRLQALVPIKMGRMATSPFGFFRGAAPLMAADLAGWPTTGLLVWMCGDAHVANLGAFAAPDGHLIFDLNDFDEAMPGPWEWDVKRLAASLVVAGRVAGECDSGCRDAVCQFVAEYRTAMRQFSKMSVFELAKYEIRRRSQVGCVRDVLAAAERVTRKGMAEKLTEKARGHRIFRFQPPVLRPVSPGVARHVIAALADYRATLGPDRQLVFDAYRPRAVAFKVAGTGSVATRDYAVLCQGKQPKDVLFLQVKEAQTPCAARFFPEIVLPENQGRRVAEAQHRMQTESDPLLGWTRIGGRDFLVRQLADHKAKINARELHGQTLSEYAFICGQALAKGHARTGDPIALAAYCGSAPKLDHAIARFALAYADQTASDHERLVHAIRARKVKALLDV